jgi:hypothetical protein
LSARTARNRLSEGSSAWSLRTALLPMLIRGTD